jgi:hypothetical protein
MTDVLVHNEADQALIPQIHDDAVALITTEEVALLHPPWSTLIGV